MGAPTSLKQKFLKKWIMGLQICGSSKKEMDILERKKAIKLAADVAMASTRTATTCWSRALIANASKCDENKMLVEHIMGSSQSERLSVKSACMGCNKRIRSKKILGRSKSISRVKKIAPQKILANSLAKRLVKKRTQVLKSLVPGGESMDEFSLIEETLDYILSLRTQVSVMRRLANATEHSNR